MRKFNKIFLIFPVIILSQTGCNVKCEPNTIHTDIKIDSSKMEKNDMETNLSDINKTICFQHPFMEKNMKLQYTYLGAEILNNPLENGYNISDMKFPFTKYPAECKANENFRSLEDYMDEEGNVNSEYTFLVLKFEAYNDNAVGIDSPNEFYVNAISLAQPGLENYDYDSGTLPEFIVYDIAYFSLHSSDEKSYLRYMLQQGERKNFELGYFVRKSDIENNMLVLSCGGKYETLKIR